MHDAVTKLNFLDPSSHQPREERVTEPGGVILPYPRRSASASIVLDPDH